MKRCTVYKPKKSFERRNQFSRMWFNKHTFILYGYIVLTLVHGGIVRSEQYDWISSLLFTSTCRQEYTSEGLTVTVIQLGWLIITYPHIHKLHLTLIMYFLMNHLLVLVWGVPKMTINIILHIKMYYYKFIGSIFFSNEITQ